MDKTGQNQTIYDSGAGADRLSAEAARIAELHKRLETPACVGSDIVDFAPGRGAFKTFTPTEMIPGSNSRLRRSGHKGRTGMMIADIFDRMDDYAQRHDQDAPFTPGQIAAGRDYGALVERLETCGYSTASLDAVARGGSAGLSAADAILRDSQRLRSLRARIGGGFALKVRRVRSMNRRECSRRHISHLAIVDLVCVSGRALSDVLKGHGWSGLTQNRIAVRDALRSSLEALQGY